MEDYRISKKFLEEAITKSSKALVGIIMKRFETFEDKNIIKASVKELIYEHFRNLKDILTSFSDGIKFTSRDK